MARLANVIRVARLGDLTTEGFRELVAGALPVAVLIPVGSVEPHGPHLPLAADTLISEAAAAAALPLLRERVSALVGPSIAYGVTECARSFPGAVSVPASVLTSYLAAVIEGHLATGAAHVCLVNSHLEPDHDAAVRKAAAAIGAPRASIASPLTPRWGKTLSPEFKSGACHAGRYETSILLSSDPSRVDERRRRELPDVPVSLSSALRRGITDFNRMGLTRAYAGSPRDASAEEGTELLARLGRMVATEVLEALGIESPAA
jgi:creatinine amidohydrolase